MKTKGYLPTALLVTLVALLLTSSIPMVFAPMCTSYPTGTIEVTQGYTFTLQHKFVWDEAAAGFYSIALYWWYWGLDDWHFTVDNYKAYFENNDPIECTQSVVDNGDLISMTFRNTVADARDGVFYCDVRLRAQGPLGTDHDVTDNHSIYYTKIRCNETATSENVPAPVIIKVNAAVRDVDVSISPSLKHGFTGDNLVYNVKVWNKGNVSDNYALDLSEVLGWPYGWVGDPAVKRISENDAEVAEGSPDANYGAPPKSNNARIGIRSKTISAFNIRAFLRFNISGVIPSGNILDSATLRLYQYYVGNYKSGVNDAQVREVSDDTWDENLVTWNTQPAMGSLIGTILTPTQYVWRELDVTSYVQSELAAGENLVSFGLRAATENYDNLDRNVYFRSRTATSDNNFPELVITYKNTGEIAADDNWTGQIWVKVSSPACTTDNLTVTATSSTDDTVSDSDLCQAHAAAALVDENIEPSHKEAWPGDITFTVIVQNNGQAPDNFTLAASSLLGCPVSLDATTLGPIAPGGTASTTLHVTLWENIVPVCTTETATVIATSVHDNTVSDTDTCTVHHKTHLRSVEIDIIESYQSAHASIVDRLINPSIRYDPLTYTIKVMNTGGLDDLYRFVVSDNEGWGLKIDPAELFIPAQDTEYASLSVTVPEDAIGCTPDNIKIEVIGKLANEWYEGVTDNARAEDWTIAHAEVIHGVAIEVLPDNIEPQTGSPGSPIVWLVVIKNIGNTWNEFLLKASDIRGWPIVWEPDNLPILLDPGKKATKYLKIENIPEDAKTCDWNSIVVTATKPMVPDVSDSTTVRVHVLEPGPRLPEGVIEIAVEAQVVAIDIWPTQWDVGILDEAEENQTSDTYFTLRNTGNVDEKVWAQGTDAQSMPGEPVTTWTLANAIGVDDYVLDLLRPAALRLSTAKQVAWPLIAPGTEVNFGLYIRAPSVITTPARMWARVVLTAVEA